MILLIKLIILKSYFVERDRNIRAILELCNKLPDRNLVGKHVMKHMEKIDLVVFNVFTTVIENVDLMVPPVWPPHLVKYTLRCC